MDVLPSYREATSKLDWLSLVAPWIPASSWVSCCLVNRRFYQYFAPRLWQDPLVTIRLLGLHPNDDVAWYRRFIHRHSKSGGTRQEARRMVQCLDFRFFALDASGLYSTEASERAISESFKALPQLFPALRCLLLDGHPELDPGHLARAATTAPDSSSCSLELLDLARCPQELSPKIFSSAFFRGLVYLDVSYIPGSLRTAIQSSLNPSHLPGLRILKAWGREVDDVTSLLLFQTFGLQLWSVNLSNNKLTDDAIDSMLAYGFSSLSFRSDAHFEVEGKVVVPKNEGSKSYGPFEFIQESSSSSSFTHPDRYLADAPIYSHRADQTELQEWQTVRSDGTSPVRQDEASVVKELCLAEALSAATKTQASSTVDRLHSPRGGITHLYLSGNRFTTQGIGRLLRPSSGRLEHFECIGCLHVPLKPTPDENRRQVRIESVSQISHLFRPVFSSNLRSLRIHHSLVTQVPEIFAEGLSPQTALQVSESVLSKNVARAYPQPFVPDMNPRISSLTLTNIPARSTGVVIERLTAFLSLASLQRENIERAKSSKTDRHPAIVGGLRHIRFELAPDFSEDELDSFHTGRENFDGDGLLDPGSENFNRSVENTRYEECRSTGSVDKKANTPPVRDDSYTTWSGRLKSAPYSDTKSDFITYHEEASSSWTGNVFSVQVWIGPGTIGPHAAVNEYMWNVQNPRLRVRVGPATPAHVAAGVPSLSYIFYDAWDAMVFPGSLTAAAKRAGSRPLRDVAAAIKDYRVRTRGTPEHWDGKLVLVRTGYLPSEYWR
ncbi:hypothetical protein GGS20DRAFT_579015 [Poronia punctata]|nr:hypothetical protein GGS20DRAFT_579015 [Poronia punctata]